MKGFVRGLIWFLVFVAVLVGVYFALPEYPQSVVKSTFQSTIDAAAGTRIAQVQNMTNADLGDITYKTILESQTKNPCWVYKIDEMTGVETVTFYGRGVAINLKDYEEYQGKLSTGAMIKIEFVITGQQVQIHPYVDGVLMELDEMTHSQENKKIRLEIFSQLYSGKGVLEE